MGRAQHRSPATPSNTRSHTRLAFSPLGSIACVLALLGAGVCVGSFATPALAAEVAGVTGKLLLATYRLPPVEAGPQEFHWEIENGVKEVAPDRVDAKRELAVALLGEGKSMLPERVEVAFSGGGLLPSTIVTRPGSTLLFANQDEFAHELYAEGVEGIAAEATSPRGRRSVAIKDAGSFALRDQLVPHLVGTVIVLADVIAVASPDGAGQFTFPEIAPGKYTLKVFHGKNEIASQAIEVGIKGLAIEPIALTAPAPR